MDEFPAQFEALLAEAREQGVPACLWCEQLHCNFFLFVVVVFTLGSLPLPSFLLSFLNCLFYSYKCSERVIMERLLFSEADYDVRAFADAGLAELLARNVHHTVSIINSLPALVRL